MFNANQRKGLKAFVRYDRYNNAIPSSLIFQKTKPKSGKWKEYVDVSLCCPTSCNTGGEPLVMEILTDRGIFEFGITAINFLRVTGTVDWGDGTVETFDFTGDYDTTYLGHDYGAYPVWIPHQVKVYFEDTSGFGSLEIGTGDITGTVLSISNIQAAIPTSIYEVDADGSLVGSIDVSGMTSLYNLYALECPNLTYLNVQGCVNLSDVELYDDNFTTLDFTGCSSLGFALLFDNPNLETVVIDGCNDMYILDIRNSALTEISVDNILIVLDSFGTFGGTVDLRGGTNSAPSVASAAAIANLTGRGWYVGTN